MGRASKLANLLTATGLVDLASKITGVLPTANAPSGSIVTMESRKIDYNLSTTASAFTTLQTYSFTKKRADTKVIIHLELTAIGTSASNLTGDTDLALALLRDGATYVDHQGTSSYNSLHYNKAFWSTDTDWNYAVSGSRAYMRMAISSTLEESGVAAGAHTYALQASLANGSDTLWVNKLPNTAQSRITFMEVVP